jgi:hypothetical protein
MDSTNFVYDFLNKHTYEDLGKKSSLYFFEQCFHRKIYDIYIGFSDIPQKICILLKKFDGFKSERSQKPITSTLNSWLLLSQTYTPSYLEFNHGKIRFQSCADLGCLVFRILPYSTVSN